MSLHVSPFVIFVFTGLSSVSRYFSTSMDDREILTSTSQFLFMQRRAVSINYALDRQLIHVQSATSAIRIITPWAQRNFLDKIASRLVGLL